MRLNQYIEYIETGMEYWNSRKQFRKIALGPLLLVLLMGVVPCIVLKGRWLILMSIMLSSSFSMFFVIFVMSSKPLTIKNRLTMQALIYTNWVIQILLLQTMFYLIVYGVNFLIVLMYIPVLATPIALGLKNAKRLQLRRVPPRKEWICLFLPFGWAGIIGASLAKSFFQQATNEIAIFFVIISLTILACVFSIGLLAYQRIYYLKKYTKH